VVEEVVVHEVPVALVMLSGQAHILVHVESNHVLEGHFKIFIGKKKDLKNADNLLIKTGITSKKKYFTAETTARAVLTELEMENGVALIDFGGGSTSVTIYHGNIMRHYASIPFGGRNITNDIKTELQITERLAENIKLAYGACMPDKLQSLSEKVLRIEGSTAGQTKEVTVKYLSEIITARVEEIIQAMLYEISESGLAEHLRGGIVITGGASQTANLGMLIKQMSGYNVRIGHPLGMLSCQDIEGINETTAATSAGLIHAAIEDECMNCAIYDETIHTEIETPVEVPVLNEEPVVEIDEETPMENVLAEEVPAVEEEIEEESYPDEEEEEDEELEEIDQEDEAQDDEDEDYDEELDEDYEDKAKPAKKAGKGENGGLFRKFKIIWNKLNDDTDNWIEGMSKK
jgi:cell division protein FtsA